MYPFDSRNSSMLLAAFFTISRFSLARPLSVNWKLFFTSRSNPANAQRRMPSISSQSFSERLGSSILFGGFRFVVRIS